ncbi:MAG TPA: hypothetical protein DCS93_09730 [Microscillaceae bacterium]|nr:hypothetical protein [Microscillaceae bacterium]
MRVGGFGKRNETCQQALEYRFYSCKRILKQKYPGKIIKRGDRFKKSTPPTVTDMLKKICYTLLILGVLGATNTQAQKVLEYKKYYHDGQAKIKAGNYQEAIADLDKAIERMPYYSAMYAERGEAKFKTKDYAGAVSDFTITLQKKPYDYQTYIKRGIAYYHLQDYVNAELDLQDALHYKPYEKQAQQYLAKTQAQLKVIEQQVLAQQNAVLATQNQQNERNRWERRQRRFYRNQLIWGTLLPLAIWTGILLWR